MFQISFAIKKVNILPSKGMSCVVRRLPTNLLCVHSVTILTYLCHLPQSIHRGFSTGLECALVSILLPSSPILINGTKPQMFKIKIFPHTPEYSKRMLFRVGHQFPQDVNCTSTFVVLLVIPIWSDR